MTRRTPSRLLIAMAALGLCAGVVGAVLGSRALGALAVSGYHRAYVAAAWLPEDGLLLNDAESRRGHNLPLLYGWQQWMARPERRWRQLHDQSARSREVRRLIPYELAGAGLALLAVLWKPLFLLCSRLGRLRPGTGYGTARWATRRDLWQLRPRRRQACLVLGTRGSSRVALGERQQYEHVLVDGPPGAGKSSGLIIPNLLSERGRRSLVITDPKNELLARTYATVSRHHEVWVVNFLNPAVSRGYNPLAACTDYLSAEAFAQCWISNTGQSTSEPFWENAARTLITAAVLHLNTLLRDEGGATLTDLRSFLCALPAELVIDAFRHSPVPQVRETATGFLASVARNERLLGSIFSELAPRFTILNDPRVQAVTSRHEIDVTALGTRDHAPVAVYLALERTLSHLLKPLSACFFQDLFHSLMRLADAAPDGALPRPVIGYLDEFGSTVGAIPNFPRWMSTVRSARMAVVLAIQDQAQLQTLYGHEGRRIILTDCATKIGLAKMSAEDARWFSEQTGTATVLARNAGASRERGAWAANRGQMGLSEIGRPLLTPGEVTRLEEDQMLVLAGNHPPVLVRQRRWYRHPRLRRLGLRRLPNGAKVPANGPPRATPLLPPPARDFDTMMPARATAPGDDGPEPTGGGALIPALEEFDFLDGDPLTTRLGATPTARLTFPLTPHDGPPTVAATATVAPGDGAVATLAQAAMPAPADGSGDALAVDLEVDLTVDLNDDPFAAAMMQVEK